VRLASRDRETWRNSPTFEHKGAVGFLAEILACFARVWVLGELAMLPVAILLAVMTGLKRFAGRSGDPGMVAVALDQVR
jgi:hypothetical protein